MDTTVFAAVLGAVAGLVGVIIGAIIQRRFSLGEMKTKTTLDLFERFNDPDVLSSRMYASDILEQNRGSKGIKSLSQLAETLGQEDWIHIERTRQFYERLFHLLEAGYLDIGLTKKFFRRLALAWYQQYFRELDALDIEVEKRGGGNAFIYDFRANDVERLLR